MTAAENLISKGFRAVMYTKGESKRGQNHTTEDSIVEARRETESHAILRLLEGRSRACYLKRSKHSTKKNFNCFFMHANLIY